MLAGNIVPDEHHAYTINNIYYDTPDFRLAQISIDKPFYKEKLRLRSYNTVSAEDDVFVEMKKKCDGIVYKRRIVLPENQAQLFLSQSKDVPIPSESKQISAEIEWMLRLYGNLEPKVFLSYNRLAFCGKDDPALRITFDKDIVYRETHLRLSAKEMNIPLVDDDFVLMEVKALGGMPFWLARALNSLEIYPSSFSKYGTYYKLQVLTPPHKERENRAS